MRADTMLPSFALAFVPSPVGPQVAFLDDVCLEKMVEVTSAGSGEVQILSSMEHPRIVRRGVVKPFWRLKQALLPLRRQALHVRDLALPFRRGWKTEFLPGFQVLTQVMRIRSCDSFNLEFRALRES